MHTEIIKIWEILIYVLYKLLSLIFQYVFYKMAHFIFYYGAGCERKKKKQKKPEAFFYEFKFN